MAQKQGKFTLLNGRVTMERSFYNPTSDAVWLAAFIPEKIKTVLDVGIGTGGVSLCLLAHTPELKLTGIEITDEMLECCRTNIKLNNANINLMKEDIFKWSTSERFDLVITNPPYFNGTPAKHDAHHNTDLKGWVKRCCARVKPNGYFCTIIDTLCVASVVSVLIDKKFGDIQIFPLFGSKISAERVIIRAKSASKAGTILYCGTSMNNDLVLRDCLTIDALLSTLGKL